MNTRRVLRDRDLLVLIGTRLTPRTSPVKGCSCPSLLTRKPPYAGRYSVGGERMVQNGRHPVFSTAYWISYEVRSVVWLLAHQFITNPPLGKINEKNCAGVSGGCNQRTRPEGERGSTSPLSVFIPQGCVMSMLTCER